MTTDNRTVAAISTPPGKGGVALIRISGADAVDIVSKVFFPESGRDLRSYRSRTAIYGEIRLDGAVIDDGILTLFYAPGSYTGEDTAEICCHGGMLVTAKVLESCFAAGAYAAGAGEFTRRAFLNGKITLSEAEAIGDLLDAKTDAQLLLSRSGAGGRLSRKVEDIYAIMREVAASVYVTVDYPEEDLGDLTVEEMRLALCSVEQELLSLADGYKTARVITEGVDTVIVGATNTGKSSLYNTLSGEDLAIVTDIEGTTRDTLITEVSAGRVLLRLCDTAGIRKSTDTVEKIGIERSIEALCRASLVLCVFDGSRDIDDRDIEIIKRVKESGRCSVAIINKCDKTESSDMSVIYENFDNVVKMSAASGMGVDSLVTVIEGLFISEKIDISRDAIISNSRQNGCVTAALGAVRDAIHALDTGMCTDMAACDIERAMAMLCELDGQSVGEDITNEIFSKFCVGK